MSERTLAERIGPVGEPVLPSHPDVAVWRPATADDIDLIHVMLLAADRVDHPTWVTPRDEIEEIFEASSYDPPRDTLLGLDADGAVVACGVVFLHPSRDVHVNAYLRAACIPDVRGRGIGRELMRWEHERALQALTEIGTTLPATILVYAEEIDVPARHLAERRGFVEERWFSTMVRDLSLEIPEIAVARGGRDDAPTSPSSPTPPTGRRRPGWRATTRSATTGGASRRPPSGGRTSSTARTCAPTCRGSPSRATASSLWPSAP